MTNKLAAVAVAALLLAGCGSPSEVTSGSSPDDAVSAPAQTDPSVDPSRPRLREPQEGLVDVYPRAFDRHRAKGRELTLFYYSGVEECYGLDHIEVREDRRTVAVTIFEGRLPSAEVCTEVAVEARSIVTLEEPLGDRKVVDGAS